MTIAECFGQHVRRLRCARGWSQADLAERMTKAGFPLHQTQIGKVESAHRPVNLDEAAAFAQVLGASVVDVFRDDATTDPFGDGYRAGYRDGVATSRAAAFAALDRLTAAARPQLVDAAVEEITP